MNILFRLFPRRDANLTTLRERDRLTRTMPGQTGAGHANRFGFLIG